MFDMFELYRFVSINDFVCYLENRLWYRSVLVKWFGCGFYWGVSYMVKFMGIIC